MQPTLPNPGEWACPNCTLLNLASDETCAMGCGGIRPVHRKEKRPASVNISRKRVKRRRKAPSRLRQEHPQRPWDTMLDPGSFSIDIMLKLFPKLGSEALTHDIYARRRAITREGKRLYGTDPYSFNKGMSLEYPTHHTLLTSPRTCSSPCIFVLYS